MFSCISKNSRVDEEEVQVGSKLTMNKTGSTTNEKKAKENFVRLEEGVARYVELNERSVSVETFLSGVEGGDIPSGVGHVRMLDNYERKWDVLHELHCLQIVNPIIFRSSAPIPLELFYAVCKILMHRHQTLRLRIQSRVNGEWCRGNGLRGSLDETLEAKVRSGSKIERHFMEMKGELVPDIGYYEVNWETAVEYEQVIKFDTERGPLWRIRICKAPVLESSPIFDTCKTHDEVKKGVMGKREEGEGVNEYRYALIGVFHHSIMDGMSRQEFWNEFLTLLQNAPLRVGDYKLFSGLASFVFTDWVIKALYSLQPVPNVGTVATGLFKRFIVPLCNPYSHSVSPEEGGDTGRPARTKIIPIWIDELLTKKIIKKAKENQTSVNSLLTAIAGTALSSLVYSLVAQKKEKRSLRRRIRTSPIAWKRKTEKLDESQRTRKGKLASPSGNRIKNSKLNRRAVVLNRQKLIRDSVRGASILPAAVCTLSANSASLISSKSPSPLSSPLSSPSASPLSSPLSSPILSPESGAEPCSSTGKHASKPFPFKDAPFSHRIFSFQAVSMRRFQPPFTANEIIKKKAYLPLELFPNGDESVNKPTILETNEGIISANDESAIISPTLLAESSSGAPVSIVRLIPPVSSERLDRENAGKEGKLEAIRKICQGGEIELTEGDSLKSKKVGAIASDNAERGILSASHASTTFPSNERLQSSNNSSSDSIDQLKHPSNILKRSLTLETTMIETCANETAANESWEGGDVSSEDSGDAKRDLENHCAKDQVQKHDENEWDGANNEEERKHSVDHLGKFGSLDQKYCSSTLSENSSAEESDVKKTDSHHPTSEKNISTLDQVSLRWGNEFLTGGMEVGENEEKKAVQEDIGSEEDGGYTDCRDKKIRVGECEISGDLISKIDFGPERDLESYNYAKDERGTSLGSFAVLSPIQFRVPAEGSNHLWVTAKEVAGAIRKQVEQNDNGLTASWNWQVVTSYIGYLAGRGEQETITSLACEEPRPSCFLMSNTGLWRTPPVSIRAPNYFSPASPPPSPISPFDISPHPLRGSEQIDTPLLERKLASGFGLARQKKEAEQDRKREDINEGKMWELQKCSTDLSDSANQDSSHPVSASPFILVYKNASNKLIASRTELHENNYKILPPNTSLKNDSSNIDLLSGIALPRDERSAVAITPRDVALYGHGRIFPLSPQDHLQRRLSRELSPPHKSGFKCQLPLVSIPLPHSPESPSLSQSDKCEEKIDDQLSQDLARLCSKIDELEKEGQTQVLLCRTDEADRGESLWLGERFGTKTSPSSPPFSPLSSPLSSPILSPLSSSIICSGFSSSLPIPSSLSSVQNEAKKEKKKTDNTMYKIKVSPSNFEAIVPIARSICLESSWSFVTQHEAGNSVFAHNVVTLSGRICWSLQYHTHLCRKGVALQYAQHISHLLQHSVN